MRLMFVCCAILWVVAGAADAAELSGTLARIKQSGKIVIGHREASQPFSFVDADKKPSGYSVDLCLRIAEAVKKKLGLSELKVDYVPVTAESRFDAVANGTIDIECGNSTNTLSRQEQIDFTNPTFITGAALLTRADAGVGSLADLADRAVSVVGGTTTETALRAMLNQNAVKATVQVVKDHPEGLALVEQGKVVAHAGDQLVLVGLAMAAKNPDQLAFSLDVFSHEVYGLALRRGDADFRLVANRVLAELYRSGDIGAIYDAWFGEWIAEPSPLLIAMFALNGLPD